MISLHTKTRSLLALNAVSLLASTGWGVASLQSDAFPSSVSEKSSPVGVEALARDAPKTGAVEENPLFTPSRKPAEDVSAGATDTAFTPPPPTLLGIVRENGTPVGAILEDPSTGSRQYVRPGREFRGWTLKEVRSRTATIRRGTLEAEVRFVFDPGST